MDQYAAQADKFNARARNTAPSAPVDPAKLNDPLAWATARIEQVRAWCDAEGIEVTDLTIDVHPDALPIFEALAVEDEVFIAASGLGTDGRVSSPDSFSIQVAGQPAIDIHMERVLGFAPIGVSGSDLLQGIDTRYTLQREGMGGDDAREAGKLL